MTIENYDVKRVLVDDKNSIYILFDDAFIWMNLSKSQLKRVSTPLVDFFENSIRVEREITLLVTARTLP